MNKFNKRIFQIIVVFLLYSSGVFAQEAASSENFKNGATGNSNTNTEEPSLSADAVVNSNEMIWDDEEGSNKQLEFETLYALNGFSLGFVALNQNYNVDAEIYLNSITKVDLSSSSSDFQAAGVMLRYAVLPINKIGTDFNFSIYSTTNNDSLGFSSITTAKAELNLAYAMPIGNFAALYVLAGGGYEVVYGNDIEKLLIPGGAAWQLGAGLGLAKKINFEVIYSSSVHSISQKFIDNAINTAITNGATTAATGTVRPKVTANLIQGRLTYSF